MKRNRKLLVVLLSMLFIVANLIGMITSVSGQTVTETGTSNETAWEKTVDGSNAKVTIATDNTTLQEKTALKVTVDKDGKAFGGVSTNIADKIAEISESYSVLGVVMKIYNITELSAENELKITFGLGEYGEWTVGKNQTFGSALPDFTQKGESEVSADFAFLPDGVTVADIETMVIGVDGNESTEFLLYDINLSCSSETVAPVVKKQVPVSAAEVELRPAMYSETEAKINVKQSVDASKSKDEDGKSIAVSIESEEVQSGLNYAVYFPFNFQRNKLELENPKGFTLWVYNETASADGGIYFKFSDGDEGFVNTVYDAQGTVVTEGAFSLNFTGFRRYELNLNYTQLAKYELEIGLWGANSEIAFNLSGFAFIDSPTNVRGDISVNLAGIPINTLGWSNDPSYTYDIGKITDAEKTHGENATCIKIMRSESAEWSVAQIYIEQFGNNLISASQARNPIAFSFWLYNTVEVPANDVNGLTFKSVDLEETEHETWNYYWQDEDGNVGKDNGLNFVGCRKYTVLVDATEITRPHFIIGVWGTSAAEVYLSDFAVFDNTVTETVAADHTEELIGTEDVSAFIVVETEFTAEITEEDGKTYFTVNAEDAEGEAYIERSAEEVFAAENTGLKFKFTPDGEYSSVLAIDFVYDDGSGVGAYYRAVDSVSFDDGEPVEKIVKFANLPYFVNALNIVKIRISYIGDVDNMKVEIGEIEAVGENAQAEQVYSKVISDFETGGQTDKWTVAKDLDTTLTKQQERENVKVGNGTMSFRFENMKGMFSWGQINYVVEDLISSNKGKEILGFSFWMYNETYVPAGELGFMIKLIQNDGLEFEVPWQHIATENKIYNGLCYDGWMKVEVPISAATANECDYNNGYDPANPRKFDPQKLMTIGIGVWGSFYDYAKGYSCNLVIDDVRILSAEPLGNIKYKIIYETNSGELPSGALELYEQGNSVVLPIPTRKGYKFNGWYTDESFTGEAVTEISASQSGDVTLYASWSKDGGCSSCSSDVQASSSILVFVIAVVFVTLIRKKFKEN